MKNNILTDSFIYNVTPTGIIGPAIPLNTAQINNLIGEKGNAVTFSGGTVALKIDLGNQRSIKYLEYSFDPIHTSNLSIKYGREESLLTSGILIATGSGIKVEPTISGYNYPRYFIITQYTTTGVPTTLNALSIVNTEEEVNFGISGTLESVTLTASNSSTYSDVQEVKIYNNGKNLSDIFVGVDPTNIDLNLFNRLELSTTSTGIFSSTYSGFNIPSEVPWEWGLSSGVKISSSNKLQLFDPLINFREFILGATYKLNSVPHVANNDIDFKMTIKLKFQGNYYVAVPGERTDIKLIDPINNTITHCPNPYPYEAYQHNQALAWDGADRIYYLRNNAVTEIMYYDLSTSTHINFTNLNGYFYSRLTRPVVVYENELYIGGARSTEGSPQSTGNLFYKLNLTTLEVTQLDNQPNLLFTQFYVLGDYIYSQQGYDLYRYAIKFNVWQVCSRLGDITGYITTDTTLNKILFHDINSGLNGTVYAFEPISMNWSGAIYSTPPLLYGICSCVDDSLLLCLGATSSPGGTPCQILVTSEVPPSILKTTVRGTWISPIFKLDQKDNKYYNLLLDYAKDSGANIKVDNSLSVDNFEIRGSDLNPSCDVNIEDFIDLDPSLFITGLLDGQNDSVTATGNVLIFSHNYVDSSTPYNSAFLTYRLPFNTTGKMQYKFWWNPSFDKLVNNTTYSKFYIVPFMNTIDNGKQPDRNVNNFERSDDDHISLSFGQASDSGGKFSALVFYNGSSSTTYGISATTGTFYEICLIIDWVAGTYSLYFNTKLLGNGNISQIRIALLKPQHTYEFLSNGQGVDFDEKFKKLTINRVGTVVADEDINVVIPVHRQDPYYGIPGTLPWYSVTINSALIPKYRYMQFKLTLRGSQLYDYPTVNNVYFPTIITCSGVPASGTGSVYMRYNFTPSNENKVDILKLKAWLKTDKE